LEGAELSDAYRKLHALESIKLVGYPGKYVASCICGWSSASNRYYLVARGALTDHILDEAEKLLGGNGNASSSLPV
jgi:hypothetical protein